MSSGWPRWIPAYGDSDHFLHSSLVVRLLTLHPALHGWLTNTCTVGDHPSPLATEYVDWKHSPSLLVCFAANMQTQMWLAEQWAKRTPSPALLGQAIRGNRAAVLAVCSGGHIQFSSSFGSRHETPVLLAVPCLAFLSAQCLILERGKILYVKYCVAFLFSAFPLDLSIVHLVLFRLRTSSCWMSQILTVFRFHCQMPFLLAPGRF